MDTGHIEHFPPCQTTYRSLPSESEKDRINLTIADEVVEALEVLGYRAAFGIPGGGISNFFHSLAGSRIIRHYLTQHELGAAYMAMGRTLASRGRSIGLCFGTSGPGVTNMITGVAAAFQERVPIFVISGNVATHLQGKGAVQDGFDSGISTTRMLEPVTAKSLTVERAEDVLPAIFELDAIARRTQLPVHLNLPTNMAYAEARGDLAQWAARREEARSPSLMASDSLASLARQILAAERPVILAGHGIKASGLEKDLARALEKTGIPAIVTSHAKGVLPDGHPLHMGCFGFAATAEARDFLKAYRPTCIAYLGTRLGELSTCGWSPLLGEPEMRVHVDRDPSQFGRSYTPTHPVCAELGEFLEVLASQPLSTESHERRAPLLAEMRKARARRDNEAAPQLEGAVNPEDLVRLLDLYLPEEAAIFSDIGNSMAWLIHCFSVGKKQDLHIPLGLGSMGSGICAAIGAKTIHTDRPVVCVAGDCSTMMHGVELFTAVQAGLAVKLLVLNDGGHGMVHHGQTLVGLVGRDVRFKKPVDFGAFGTALGIKTFQARNLGEFTRLPLDDLLRSPEPVIIEIKIDPGIAPPIGDRAKILASAEKAKAILEANGS